MYSYLTLGISIILAIFAQILFKYSAQTNTSKDIITMLLDYKLALGFLIYFFSAILYIYSLKKIELSIAYPTISLSYVAILFLSFFLFGETITLLKVLGCSMIVLGVFLLWV